MKHWDLGRSFEPLSTAWRMRDSSQCTPNYSTSVVINLGLLVLHMHCAHSLKVVIV